MANNLIQIKRSTTTAVPASLANGEFAITSNGDVLYIGSNGAVLPVGGKRVPGVLTANQALVANATSGIDKIIVANAAVSQLNANGATGTAGQILKSGGPGANSYWSDTSAGVAGSDTQIQFNDGGSLAGSAGFTFNKTTNNVTIANNVLIGNTANAIAFTSGATYGGATAGATVNSGTIGVSSNTTVNASVTPLLVQVSNSTSTANLTAVDLKIGATTVVNASQVVATLLVGNVSGTYANISGQVNTATLYAATSANIASAVQANATGIWTTGTANATNFTAGAGFGAATAGVTVNSGTIGISSNTTVNATHTASLVQVANSTSTANLTASGLIVYSNATVNATHTASLVQVSNSTSTANLTAVDLKIGATTVVNSTQVTATLLVGNVSGSYANITGQVNTATLYAATSANIGTAVIANSTGIWTTGTANAASHTTGAGFGAATAGATVNTSHIAVSSNSTVNATHTATLIQVANSTGIANLTAIDLKIGNFIANSGAVTLGGTLSANASTGTAGQVLVSGAATNAYWTNSLGVFQFTDLTVSGNLSVLGDLVTLNVATLAVEDPLIVLAKDQSNTGTFTDAVDIGFYGSYGNTAQKNWTGLFRDQSDSGIYKLFSGYIPEPTTTVDTTNVNFAYATLQGYLKAGGATASGLIANSSVVNITANSTMSVALVANTLSLSTALPATSGGTGTGTFAVGDLLVGNSTNTLTKLAAGTDGYVLQINGTGVVAWNTLDGGTF